MTKYDNAVESVQIACEICLKEVPVNDSTNPETEDYFAHFCGLECYDIWKNQDGKKLE